ncbi:MAG TPA: FliA/WhiG family RNA polymerase sigma factor [Bacillota bacterium]|nr:FliA/WhiG family RNA polymerase sigma factor [Bacillota bacterium]HOB42681.1 FliA/WhiG family RNA polymerase sigma factor [Bacillota bacterium]HPZ13851.1 FliA/WhiG family RNA polymerase sigma factor [Bacillota bacterium]HQD80291.1 FliA/WhiG family RNA polymerase sigma factor [Bacillota bacterium]
MKDDFALWQEYSKTNSSAVREQLIVNYAYLVKYIVSRMPQAAIPGVDYDDLVGYGVLGLIDAIERFDMSRGVKFETYAMTRIRGSIIDNLRRMDWAPRSVRHKARQIECAMADAESVTGRPATDEEIADRLKVDIDTLHRWTWEISMASYSSLDELIAVDDEHNVATLLDFVSDDGSPDPEMILEKDELYDALADAIDHLPEREGLVIKLYYFEEMTIKEIARVLGVSESRVSQLHTKAMMRIRVEIMESRGCQCQPR